MRTIPSRTAVVPSASGHPIRWIVGGLVAALSMTAVWASPDQVAAPATTTAPQTVAAPQASQGAVAAGASTPASGAPAPAAETAKPAGQSADAKVTCREARVTGSRLQKRKVCSTPDSEGGSADWVREQQARGAIGASAILNGGQ